MIIQVSEREIATILAALRAYQGKIHGDDIHAIATDNGRLVCLNDDEVDSMCARITVSPITHVAAIACSEGIDLYLGTNAELKEIVFAYARRFWNDLSSGHGDTPPADADACISEYFGCGDTGDEYRISDADFIIEQTRLADPNA